MAEDPGTLAAKAEDVDGGAKQLAQEAAPAPAASTDPAAPQPRIFSFGCPNGRAVTFIQEGGHGDSHGGPAQPRDVRCPVCGQNMTLQEPQPLPL
ncbi:MAG: hypothetical protein ACHQC8_02460 [Solirubrobacterales bacterium]